MQDIPIPSPDQHRDTKLNPVHSPALQLAGGPAVPNSVQLPDAPKQEVEQIIATFQKLSENKLITQVFPFQNFKASRAEITNYYYNNPKKPFCESFINPKLKLLLDQFSSAVNPEKLKHLK